MRPEQVIECQRCKSQLHCKGHDFQKPWGPASGRLPRMHALYCKLAHALGGLDLNRQVDNIQQPVTITQACFKKSDSYCPLLGKANERGFHHVQRAIELKFSNVAPGHYHVCVSTPCLKTAGRRSHRARLSPTGKS